LGDQISFTLEEEIIIVEPIEGMVSTMVEMICRTLILGRALESELEKNFVVVVAKLKAELDETSNSLKVTLEAMGCLEEQSH